MIIPINGRIAIIDNEIKQAMPLLQLFAKNQLPYVFYKGDDQKFLPNEGQAFNDIRLLFLDINLIDEGSPSDKQLKSVLIGVLKRIISSNNYPYLLIYWSRHENEHSKLVEEIFREELKDRAPINFLPLKKSDYFDLSGDETALYDEKIPELFQNINNAIRIYPVYSYLTSWENQIHSAADSTLEGIFKSVQSVPNWESNANYLFKKLGQSYSGKNYEDQEESDKILSSLYTLNYVFNDSLEFSISSKVKFENAQPLLNSTGNIETIYSINSKLLFSEDTSPHNFPGTILECSNPKCEQIYKELLTLMFNRKIVSEEISKENPGLEDKELTKQTNNKSSSTRNEIRNDWKKIWLISTPLCDYIQKKQFYDKIIRGIMIKEEYRKYIDDKSEAFFISPKFKFNSGNYIFILDFRQLFSMEKIVLDDQFKAILRIRQQLLAEIQSKLARHINRQGVLFLEE